MEPIYDIKLSAKNDDRRTNSLGYAKNDCHTCAVLKKSCDRQRPRCGTCISSRQKCGGFAMDLVWKGPAVFQHVTRSSRGNGPGPTPRRPGAEHRHGRLFHDRHEFKFVQGRPKRKRKPKDCVEGVAREPMMGGFSPFNSTKQVNSSALTASPEDINTSSSEPWSSSANLIYDKCANVDNGLDLSRHKLTPHIPSHASFGSSHLLLAQAPRAAYGCAIDDGLWPNSSPSNDFSLEYNVSPPLSNTTRDFVTGPLQEVNGCCDMTQNGCGSNDMVFLNRKNAEKVGFEDQSPLTISIRYRDLAHKYSPVLTMYDEEFCVMPLSSDCSTNPFRVQTDRCEGSAFLLHAVLALCSQHLAKKNNCADLMAEMYNHRSKAIQLFSEALCNTRSNILPLLDTILVLVNLEVAQSASGMWGVHLNGARRLLEEAGPVERYPGSSRIRAQLAMLVWWDVTIAFLSRKEPRLPITYLGTLMEYDESDGWSFFILNGCPAELVMAMARLGKLAAIYEKTTLMEWTIFNRLSVDHVVEEVKNFVNDADVSLDDVEKLVENADTRRNRFHCVEAWRHAILLYVSRVFTRKQDELTIRLISHLTRVILDHVRCIPRTEVIQKQLLLPIFLAASEVGDEQNRHFALQYCKHWSIASRFFHFQATAELLENIWSDWSPSTRDVYWWGAKVGSQAWPHTEYGEEQSLVSEVLLG